MHELGVVIGLFETLEQIMAEHNLTQITRVVLDVGEMSGILPDYLQECWKAAGLESRFEHTELEQNIITAKAKCTCGCEFELMKNSRKCPACQKSDYTLTDGTQFDINHIVTK